MADDSTQRAAFKFFRERLQTQATFTFQEFIDATGWEKPGTCLTYMRKHYKGLVEKVDETKLRKADMTNGTLLRVTDAFWKFATWRRFKSHVTQVRRVVTNYEGKTSKVLIYDFFMPLTNEEYLRMALDALFFRDRIEMRLKSIGATKLKVGFPGTDGHGDEEYFQSLVEFIKNHLFGYSVFHVDGRYRSDKLLTQDQASILAKAGERYLFDETTAVTRFIFPYESDDELSRIRFVFQTLFIRSIVQLVNGEEQIWMVESGSAGSQLHRWERIGDGDEGGDDEEDDDDEEE